MKKIIISLFALLFLATPVVAMEVWQYGSFKQRALMAVECGIVQSPDQYYGTYEQNIALKNCKEQVYLQVISDPWTQTEVSYDFGLLGGQRPSDFRTTLAESLSATASTTEEITLSSVTTKDGHALTSDDIGDFILFKINPGASNQELVACTGGISGTTILDCSRGYSLYQNAVEGSKEKSHSPGETVIITNDDAYLNEQFVSKENVATTTGKWTYSYAEAGIVKMFFGDDNQYIWANTSTNQFGFATSRTEFTFNEDGTTFTAVPPLILSGGELKIGTSTLSGLRLDNNGRLQIATSTGSGIYIDSDNTLKVATTSDYNFTGGFQLNGVQLDGIGATATSGALNNLTSASSTNADYLHTHELQTAYDVNTTVATSSGQTEANLRTHTIVGGDMGANGIAKVHFHGLSEVKNNVVWIGSSFGGMAIATVTPGATHERNNFFSGEIEIQNRGSESLQWAIIRVWTEGINSYVATSTELSIDTSADQKVVIQGDNLDASQNTSIRSSWVEIFRKD
uniref:Uncharacterized protein n=1 Tax=viral metagenome TaxID=1070528 RepID=A0A6H1ZF10_9ZZZZ